MKIFLVRHAEEKTILGLFWTGTIKDLWWEVDGTTDPYHYEYAELHHGSLHFGDVEPSVAQAPDGDESDSFDPPRTPWDQATPSEHLWAALHRQSDERWTRFPAADHPGGGAFEAVKKARAAKREGAS